MVQASRCPFGINRIFYLPRYVVSTAYLLRLYLGVLALILFRCVKQICGKISGMVKASS